MDQMEQTLAFCRDLEKLIDRYRDEFELTAVCAIGVLEMMKFQLQMEQVSIVVRGDGEDNG